MQPHRHWIKEVLDCADNPGWIHKKELGCTAFSQQLLISQKEGSKLRQTGPATCLSPEAFLSLCFDLVDMTAL